MIACRSAGVDTWSPCWYVDPDSTAASVLSEMATIGAARGRLLPEPVAGHRVGYFGATGMIYAEGHPEPDGLANPGRLPAALDRLELALLSEGVPLPVGRAGVDAYGERYQGFGGIRRLDSTVDLSADSSAEGFAVLAGIAAVARDMPRTKANVWWDSRGRVQTVALHGYGGGKMLGRVYDKGAESGNAPPGRLIRPEDQRRWAKDGRRLVTELDSRYVRGKFHQRFVPLWQASKGVTVAGPIVIAEKLAAAVEAGEISRAAARNLVGDLVLDLAESAAVRPSRATRYRHARKMRDHGLALADGVLQEVEVDLGQVLEAMLDSRAWGCDQ